MLALPETNIVVPYHRMLQTNLLSLDSIFFAEFSGNITFFLTTEELIVFKGNIFFSLSGANFIQLLDLAAIFGNK